jgi:hypothetical protein
MNLNRTIQTSDEQIAGTGALVRLVTLHLRQKICTRSKHHRDNGRDLRLLGVRQDDRAAGIDTVSLKQAPCESFPLSYAIVSGLEALVINANALR